ncbi:MAG: hypothetical protein ACLQU4_00055 [Limisphaerales bacterium]
MEHLRGLSPEQKFLRMVFVHSTRGVNVGEQQTLWVVTGEAAFLGLIISHIESVSKIICPLSLKWGIVFLAISILCGVIAKHVAMSVQTMIILTEDIYKEFNSEQGQLILSNLKMQLNDLAGALSKPFLWPFRSYIQRSFYAGAKDWLSAEKKAVKWLCFYIYFSVAQWLLGVAGLFCFAFGIQ